MNFTGSCMPDVFTCKPGSASRDAERATFAPLCQQGHIQRPQELKDTFNAIAASVQSGSSRTFSNSEAVQTDGKALFKNFRIREPRVCHMSVDRIGTRPVWSGAPLPRKWFRNSQTNHRRTANCSWCPGSPQPAPMRRG